MTDKWILEGHEPVPATLMQWAEWYETADRIVAHTRVAQWMISTVFLGIDHSFLPGEAPVLFETMRFDTRSHRGRGRPYQDVECHRYTNWDAAEAHHWAIVARWRNRHERRL